MIHLVDKVSQIYAENRNTDSHNGQENLVIDGKHTCDKNHNNSKKKENNENIDRRPIFSMNVHFRQGKSNQI